jgi:hypothetical protein
LPAPVKSKMEGAFGFDFGSVRVHEGEHAGALGAAAYTQGDQLHFAPGQYDPSSQGGQELIGHELAHVVQQGEGRVAATTQFKGVDGNDDAGLEHEADTWGARAARGEPVGRGGGGGSAAGGSIQRKVVQRSPQPTHSGRFLDTDYTQTGRGVTMTLEFEPGAEVDATKIGLSQSVKTLASGSPIIVDPQTAPRQVPSGAGAGFEIDRVPGRNDPIYGSPTMPAGQGLSNTPMSNAPAGTTPEVVDPAHRNTTYRLGFHHSDGTGPHAQNAQMMDRPAGLSAPSTGMEFETTALAIEGTQAGTYYGSVKWGWNIDAAGTVTRLPFTVASQGVPTQNFLAAAGLWNSATAGGTLKARNAPTQIYARSGGSFTASFTITQNTVVLSNGIINAGAAAYVSITIQGGPHNGQSGFVPATDLVDQNDGLATIDLPTPTVETLSSPQTLNDGVPGPWRDSQTLAAGTRVERTGRTPGSAPPATKAHVRVVDGANTGAQGYVETSALARERP